RRSEPSTERLQAFEHIGTVALRLVRAAIGEVVRCEPNEAAAAAPPARTGADPGREGEETAAGLTLTRHRAGGGQEHEGPTGRAGPRPARDAADRDRQPTALGVAEGHPEIPEHREAPRS